jgi:DinB superfamily
MKEVNMLTSTEQASLLARLSESRDRLLVHASTGTLHSTTLRELANTEISLTLELFPMPLDPSEHVRAAHASARPYLDRVAEPDPTHLVAVDEAHSYTPRKILRRILDHALDHLNQVDQWLAWRRQGVAPTPTDGWATSAQTLQEDLLPVALSDLRSWLWRIDLTVALLAQRAQALTVDELDWIPPDGGWTLRGMLHHVASAERYYVIWLDQTLSDEPVVRYQEANRRFVAQWRRVIAHPLKEQEAHFRGGDTPTTAQQVAEALLAAEQAALSRSPAVR